MMSGRYQQRHHSQSHRAVGGQSRWVARTAAATTTTSTAAAASNLNATSSATLSSAASVTAAAAQQQQPAVLDQIANLLNLAQNLMSTVKEQQQRKQHRHRHQPQRNGAEHYTTRRNLRLQAAAPYQRLATEPPRTPPSASGRRHSNGSANSQSNANTNSILNSSARLNSSDASNGDSNGNGDGDGGSAITNGGQLNETQFCSCAECSARKLRSQVVVVGGDRCGAGATATNATPTRTANPNYMQQRNCNGSHSNNNGTHTSANFQCSICLESYLLQWPTATLCGHIFCRLCILECLNCQGKCPICNRKLNRANVFRVFF